MLLRIGVALLPLATVPVLIFLIAEGVLNLGGGEKDLLLVGPWALWSLIFAVSSLLLWARGWSLSRAVTRSAVAALIGVVAAGLLLVAASQLGVAGM